MVDYKSGKRSDWISGAVKELEHFKKDLQFQLYNLVLKVLYPQYKVRVFTVFYTSDGGPFTFYFTEEEEKEAWEKIRRIYSEILASEMPERLKDDYTRKATHWKCKNVCQFGREFLVKYKDINSDRIERHIIDNKDLVSCFEDQGTIWEMQGLISLCDYYHGLIRKQNNLDASQKLIQLTVEGGEQSRRNDYSNPKIFKGSIS